MIFQSAESRPTSTSLERRFSMESGCYGDGCQRCPHPPPLLEHCRRTDHELHRAGEAAGIDLGDRSCCCAERNIQGGKTVGIN